MIRPGQFRALYVCIGRGPARYAYVTPRPNERAVHVFGPAPSRKLLDEAVRWLNNWFRLRDCPDRVAMCFANQLELFGDDRRPQCARHDLGTCPAPCAARCTTAGYAENVAAAKAFLDGVDTRLLDELRSRMLTAASELEYERAANLRDAWRPLAWLNDKLQWLRRARREFSFVYPIKLPTGRRYWLVFRHGHLVDWLRVPFDAVSATKVQDRLEAGLITPREPAGDGDWTEDMEHVLLVSSWFHSHANELAATLPPQAAAETCQALASFGRMI
jgi:excinuclease ABC subunit C